MVLQQAHRAAHAAPGPRLDAGRILGISGTLAINVLAMLLLLAPMALPTTPAFVEPRPDITVVDIVPLPPVTLPPPERVQVVQPQTRPQPTPRIDTPVPQVEQIIVDHGTLPAETPVDLPAFDSGPVDMAPSAPLTGARLEYGHAPAPDYPRDAVRRGLEGTVMLEVLVDVDGKPLEVRIHRSSGHALLDRQAQRHVLRHWTFHPATRDGRPVQALGLIPIGFSLQ